MFCSNCGSALKATDSFCGGCGTRVPVRSGGSPAPTARATSERVHSAPRAISYDRRAIFAVVGALVGTMLGYVLRPSAFLVGQLPFSTVISRGANLDGLDQLLVPTAQSSFNLLVAGAIFGAVVGAVIAMFAKPAMPRREDPLESA